VSFVCIYIIIDTKYTMGNMFSSKPMVCPRPVKCPDPAPECVCDPSGSGGSSKFVASAPLCPKFTESETAKICNDMSKLYDAIVNYERAGGSAEASSEQDKRAALEAQSITSGGQSATQLQVSYDTFTNLSLKINNPGGATNARNKVIKVFDDNFIKPLMDKYKNSKAYTAAKAFESTPAGEGCKYKKCGGATELQGGTSSDPGTFI